VPPAGSLGPVKRQEKDHARGSAGHHSHDMARVYRDVESGKRDSQEGASFVYMLTQIAKVLELTEIERRLTELEERSLGSLTGST
jgi:hypothetical protein